MKNGAPRIWLMRHFTRLAAHGVNETYVWVKQLCHARCCGPNHSDDEATSSVDPHRVLIKSHG